MKVYCVVEKGLRRCTGQRVNADRMVVATVYAGAGKCP
jgi:hypothetical protein